MWDFSVFSAKDHFWEWIENEFNEHYSYLFRSAEYLKAKYQNMKKNTKSKLASNYLLLVKKTGGGKSEKVNLNADDYKDSRYPGNLCSRWCIYI